MRCICGSWKNWWMKWLSHFPLYLRSHGDQVKFPLTGTPIFKKEGKEYLGSYKLVSFIWVPSQNMEIMLRPVLNKKVISASQHGFIKGKPCPTYLVAYYNALVDKGRASDIIYQDLWKALDTVLNDTLAPKLNRHGFDHSVDEWMGWLDNDMQRAATNSLMSKWKSVTGVVPQGLIWGLALFPIFVSDVGSGI